MHDDLNVGADMIRAEMCLREAMIRLTPAARCEAIMDAYWHTPEEKRDAFVLVLAGNLTLRAASSPGSTT